MASNLRHGRRGRGGSAEPDLGMLGGLPAYLRQQGFRLTPQRLAVAAALEASAGTHPTADEICSFIQTTLPTVSLATVYNTLAALVAAGFVAEVDVPDGPRRYDLVEPGRAGDAGAAPGASAPHAHVSCVACGRLADVELPEAVRRVLEDRIREQAGYRPIGRWPVLYGLCPLCEAGARGHSDAGTRRRGDPHPSPLPTGEGVGVAVSPCPLAPDP